MSDTQSVSERVPEDDLPGSGLFFDDTANEPEPSVTAAAVPIADAAPGPEESAALSALSTGGAALAGLDAAAVEKLLTKVALRRYTKRIEEAVDARLDDLDWSEVAAGIESRVAGHVAEAAGVNTETGEISDNSAAAPDTEGSASVTEETEEAPEPAFRTVYDFYEGIYGPLYEHFDSAPGVMAQRGTTGIRWCRQWWNHQSVMMRMTALWQGYEVAYAEGGGAVSTWMLDHADRHFDRIMAEGGPLSECRSDHGDQMVRYPTDPLPEGLNLDATTVQTPGPTE
ncbi:DUF4913 domain-containing protein [Arthrobacter sp. MA-N2]|uniref:DUF4913 domain-containing protein n=1 Tax=Arthrobacter sp. MA-N2 TaxID=1101188 RepID=UPI00048A204B|nr:DUF4913 domain-containing protein [Arthrobacter sp. MA-N2]